MNPEEKIAVCVKNYKLISDEQNKKRRTLKNWKIVKDGQLFWKSIFCSVINGEEWEAGDSDLIISLLNKNVWYCDPDQDVYVIDQDIQLLKGKVGNDAIFLRLAYIALLGDNKKGPFVKAVIDIVFLDRSVCNTVSKDDLGLLSAQVGEKWNQPLKQVFETHFGKNNKYKSALDEIYRRHCNFFDNMINKRTYAHGFFTE